MAKKAQPKQKNEPRSLPKWIVWTSVGLIIVIIAVVYFVARSSQEASQRLSPTPTIALPAEISVEDADILLQNNAAFFLDVRPATGWIAYHIDKSVSIPLDELSAHVSELPNNRVIVVVDGMGDLSPQARDVLKKAGFSSVTSIIGGMEAWVQGGYPFIGTAPY